MKNVILLVISFAILFGTISLASQSSIRTKDYSCDELRELVKTKEQHRFKGLFGSTFVHATPHSCGSLALPRSATWRTNNKFFCTAGYLCVPIDITDDD